MEEEIDQIAPIPLYINAESFIAARMKELHTLTGLMKKQNRVASIFQRLPKRMRRRAMSHTVKRLPRNLREAHKRQLLKNKALQKSKNKRKLHRKRPKKLLLEYNRRQKTNLWLETHIWHAKRFRMLSQWGYKLADRSYDKTFRVSYRAMKSHCLIQDMSYYSCIEVTGAVNDIIEGMSSLTNNKCNLSVGAKCWLNGNREGTVTIYHSHRYPYDVIGSVTFIWRPSTGRNRTLWLWCHPSFYYEVLDELIDVFKLELDTSNESEMEISESESLLPKSKKSKADVQKTLINLKNVPVSRVPRYINRDKKIIVSSLKDTLNRFRLSGPLSNAVLSKALHSVKLFDKVLDESYVLTKLRKLSESQPLSTAQLLEKYSSPSLFPSHVIMGDCIVDPRLFLKRKREKAVPSNEENEYCLMVPSDLNESLIWDSVIRDMVSLEKITTAKINHLRSKLLVPGFDEQLLKTVNTVIPILLIQRPGSNSSSVKTGFGSGWDIILPANWAMPVWLSLILCGAKPGGLRETKTLTFETQAIPELFPDSRSGMLHYDNMKEDCENLYFKKPPNKRVNFIKYGIPTPFHCPWQTLVEEWSPSKPNNPYFVFRDRHALRDISAYLSDCAKTKSSRTKSPNFSFPAGSLIAVHVTMVAGGALCPLAHICLPTEADLRRRMRDKMFVGPCETPHLDVNRKKRKELRLLQTKTLKRLRRKRIKEKRSRMAKNGLPARLTKRKVSPTAQLVNEYREASRSLWIPNPAAAQLRKHCDREICGFVTMSGFSYMRACTMGLGYITSESFCTLLDLQSKLKCQPMVLTRSPNSLCYRFCSLNVVTLD